MEIRPATPADVAPLLALADAAVAWLVARGRAGQWGDSPLSASPDFRHRIVAAVDAGLLTVAERAGSVVGAVLLDTAVPPYVPAGLVPPDALYVHSLITDRTPAGTGAGRALLHHARTVAAGRPLALDHWAGAPELATLYARAGYAEVGTFTLTGGRDTPWPGTVRVRPGDAGRGTTLDGHGAVAQPVRAADS